jgi:hypothetical protein
MAAYNFRHPRRFASSKTSVVSSVPPQHPPEDKKKLKRKDFLQLLARQFPSKYSKRKAAAASDEESDGYETVDSVEEEELEKGRTFKDFSNITTLQIIVGRESDEDDSEYDSDYVDEEEDDEEDDDDEDEDDEDKKEEDKQYDEYLTIIRQKKFDATKERKFFKGLSSEERTDVLAKLKELDSSASKPVPPRIAILRTNIPTVYKSIALEKWPP